MNITIENILDALKTTRKEFGGMFIQAQGLLPIDQRYEFETIAVDTPNDRSAYQKAIQHAQIYDFFKELLMLIVQSGLESGLIAQQLLNNGASIPESTLQSIVNANGFTEPHTYYQGIAQSMKWTGKVIIQGQDAGTGVLIGANLFLTAWHVVKKLFNPDQTPKAVVIAEVEFDNFLYLQKGLYNRSNSERVKFHQDWHVAHCRCHDQELIPTAVLDPACFKDHWDYVILRLDRTLGFDRGWAKLDSRAVVPPKDQKIVLFQHPAGQAMRIDQNEITGFEPEHPGIPKFRFLHLTNALHGSSGGPCFDKEFALVGIHQGSWPEGAVQAEPAVAVAISRNRGIPITNIIDHIKQTIIELPVPMVEDSPVFWLKDQGFEPIMGCDEFQSLIWAMVLRQQTQILSITGETHSGKSFLLKVADTLLSDQRHLKISLPAERIAKIDVIELLTLIATELGVPVPTVTPFHEYDNTASMWLRNHVFTELINILNSLHNGRLVWIFLGDLNRFTLEGAHVSEFILTIMDLTKTVPWLRIVLDGYNSILPTGIRPISLDYRNRKVTREDIKNYLNRSFIKLGINENAQLISGILFSDYEKNLTERPETALNELRIMAMNTLNNAIG
ncbi:trypsin-like peptidase domain-containing protein [Pedobacter sp.]|uniref:trypsin-like peptidase domain-containing protein n=1 Tax=Pedobacter sp. TaxID=1411316 RepID=UPI003BAD69CB